MADQVDSMSDAELRTKLAEYGFPVMPVTASTRKLLVKKLKLVLDNKAKPRNSADKAETRRSLAKYSSGEESDLDTNNAKEKKSRRTTTGASMLPPASNSSARTRRPTPKKELPVKRDSDKESEESEEEKSSVRTEEEVETVTTRRVKRIYGIKDRDDYETGSDSDVDADKKTSAPYRSNSRSSDYISSTLPTNDASTTPPKTSIFSRPSLPTNYSSMSSYDQLNSIRSRLGLTSTTPTLGSYTSNYTNTYQPTTSTDEVQSPYLTNFTQRLSSLKADPPKTTSYLDRDVNNGTSVFPRRSYITGVPRSDVVDYKTVGDKKFLKNNIVPLVLVGIVALFFLALFSMYIVKRNDITSVVDDQNSIIPICQTNIPGNRPGINCVQKEQVSYAKDLLKVIHPELTSKAAAFKCGKPGALPYLTDREILDIATSRTDSLDPTQCRLDLNNLQVLIVNNPRWGLSVVQLKSLYTKDAEYSSLTSVEEVARQRSKGTVAISITDPSTPISCLAVNTLYSAGSTLIVAALLAAAAFGSRRLYNHYLNYRKRKNDELYSMVEQIIDVISQETEDSGEPYISVDHVRDTLISPQNRDKMCSVWDAAVNFIQRNESRVRMEVQSVNGEDCRVWRWVSAHSSPRRSAAWQGQAFETQEGSVNNLPISPTQCLKIRHMFNKNDANPNLRIIIQDEILEKCGDGCKILHIDVDRSSCCVYVKCATQTDAGDVYRSLHGWWYDGRLITVKYLRLERYMQRFPNSPTVGPYLKPSRPKRYSDD